MSTGANEADTLIEALPYTQEFAGSVMVIKIGGNSIVKTG